MRSAPVPTSGSGVSLEEGEEGMYSDNFSHRATTLSASSNFATATSNDHETPSRSTSSKLPLVTVLSFASTAVLPSTTSIAPTQPFAGSDPQAPFIPSPLATSANATTPTSLPPAQSFDTTTHSSSSTTFGPAPSIDRPPPFASSVTPHPAQQAIAPDTSTTNDSSDVIIPKPTLIDVMRALRGLAKGAEL